MSLFRHVPWNSRRWMAGLLLAVCLVGCSNGGPRADPVDVEQARQTLQQALDSWAGGQSPESLKEQTPSIVVQDMDWQRGFELASYEVLAPGEARDANWYCDVKLELRDPQNQTVQRTVTYIVGTDPVLTVFREIFP